MTVQPEHGSVYPDWTLGDRIRKARNTVGLTQGAFAVAIKAAEGSVAAWETDRSIPRNLVTVAKRIELLTRIPASWILGLDDGHGQPTPPPRGGAAANPSESDDYSANGPTPSH